MQALLKRIAETISDWVGIAQNILPTVPLHFHYHRERHEGSIAPVVQSSRGLLDCPTDISRSHEENRPNLLILERVGGTNRFTLVGVESTVADNAAEDEFIASMSGGSKSPSEFVWRDLGSRQ